MLLSYDKPVSNMLKIYFLNPNRTYNEDQPNLPNDCTCGFGITGST